MTDQYAKGCKIEPILPQSVSPTTESFAKSVINQMSIMCVDYITEQLSKSYREKYNVFMEGKDRDDLRILAKRKCAEYLSEASKSLMMGSDTDNEEKYSTKIL